MTTKSVSLKYDNDITIQDRLDHANRQMIVLSALRETELYMTPAEALDLASKLQSLATDVLRKSRPKRVMRVRWRHGLFATRSDGQASEHGSGGLDEVYHLQAAGGKFHRVNRVPGNGQYVPGSDELEEWFERLGVTHIEVTQDFHEELPDGEYPVKKYVRWLRKWEEEAE